MERRMNGGWGRRGTRGKRNNERDAYVSFLIVTGSTLRYRPREARPCHYYPIISCITVTVNEVSYYAARRGGGWKKRGERRPYVSWGKGGYIQIHDLSKVSIKGKDYLFRILVSSLSKCSSLKAYLFLRWLNFIVLSNDVPKMARLYRERWIGI